MQKKKKIGLLWALLALAALLGAIVYMRAKPAVGSPEKPAPTAENFPIYSHGSALENTAEGQFRSADSFICEDGETELYRYKEEIPASDAQLFAAGNGLFIIGGSEILCIDVKDGESAESRALLAREAAFGEDYFAGTIEDGSLWLAVTGEEFAFYIFGQNGEERLHYSRAASGGALWAAVSPDGAALAAGFEGRLQVFDLVHGRMSEKRCGAEKLKNVYFGDNGIIYGEYAEGGVASLDTESGKIRAVQGLEKATPVSAEYAAAQADYDGTLALFRIAAPEEALYLPGEGAEFDEASLVASAGMLLRVDGMGRYTGSVRRLYNLADGSLIQWVYDGTEAPRSAVLSAGFGWGAFLSEGSIYLFPADRIADSVGTEDAVYLAGLPATECGDVAREVYAATGIKMHWGESGADFNSETFTASPADDENCLPTMQAVARFLLALPEGIVHELLAGTAKELRLYICSGIHAVPDLGWSTGGFTDIIDGNLCIAINTDDFYWVDGNIAHEFWHAMEYRMRTLERVSGTEYISGWEALMGEKLSGLYWDRGLNTIGSEWQQEAAFCADGETDAERVWFVRAYSRSDPGEDRATVFEALNWTGEQGLFARYPHLREKADYLCAAIRACYPSCAGSGLLPWETCLEER